MSDTPRTDALKKMATEETIRFHAEGGALLVWAALQEAERELAEARRPVSAGGRDELYTQATIDSYERELAEAKRQLSEFTRWIPLSERVPENAAHVLVYAVPYVDPMTAIRIEGGFRIDGTLWFDSDDDACFVSHWMPLPEAPK